MDQRMILGRVATFELHTENKHMQADGELKSYGRKQ